MTSVIAGAFKDFELAHRKASDSLEQGKGKPADVRARLIEEASKPFKELDEKTQKAFADSLLSNQLLEEITQLQVQQALEGGNFALLVPPPSAFRTYLRHARKRGLGFAAEAGNFSLAA